MDPANEFPDQNNQVVVTFLNLLLADEYVLYTKTRTAHWNVVGLHYFELHVFLENQYNTLDVIIDEIADQIRSLGHYALGSLKDFLSIAQISEDNSDFANSGKIFETLLGEHESIIHKIQHEIFPIATNLKDVKTSDFLKGILAKQKKMARQLKSLIANPELNKTNNLQINFNPSVNQQQA